MGLSLDVVGWSLGLLVCLGWLTSLSLVPRLRHDGVRALVMSLFGLIWIGFGLNMVFRFLVLSFDSVDFGNSTYRLADIPAESVSNALLASAVYWIGICAGYGSTRFLPKGPGLYAALTPLANITSRQAVVLMWFGSMVLSVLASIPELLPGSILTPMGALARLWVIPAALVWGLGGGRFRDRQGLMAGVSRREVYQARALTLVPPLLTAVISPYRESLVLTILVPLIARLYAGFRISVTRLVVLAGIALLGSSLSVGVLRMVRWDQMTVKEAVETASASSGTFSGLPQGLEDLVRRFHAFDSLLLTLDRVPRVVEHSGRGLFLDAALSGFVPRLLLPWKESGLRAQGFVSNIWADVPGGRENPAAIAPSMAGDTYDAQGWFGLTFGSIVWGLLVGMADRWRGALSPAIAAAVVALLGLQCAASIERDFVTTVATFLQTNVALAGGIWLVRMLSASTRGGVMRRRVQVPPPNGLREGRARVGSATQDATVIAAAVPPYAEPARPGDQSG